MYDQIINASVSSRTKARYSKGYSSSGVSKKFYFWTNESPSISNQASAFRVYAKYHEATPNKSKQQLIPSRSARLLAKKIDDLASLAQNWNSYGAEAPNSIAINAARGILERLIEKNFLPGKAVPSAENGVALVFTKNDRYADIECFNTGEIIAMLMDGKAVRGVFQLNFDNNEIDLTIEQLSNYING